MNDERWVQDRLRALDPAGDWRPNTGAAFAGLQWRDRRRRIWHRGFAWSTAVASVAGIVMLALPAPARCAIVGVGCPRVVAAAAVAVEPPLLANYKESGSPNAPVVIEIYTDYECPHCANFYSTVFPQLVSEFVKTGKVRIVHRDFPMPQHPHARLAARYANAAGELGHYDEVVRQLFATQPEWAGNGNVDAAVSQVVSAETMRRIRALVESDPKLDATLASDMAIVARDGIHETPSMVFIHKGMRQKVAGLQSFPLLRSYVDGLLTK